MRLLDRGFAVMTVKEGEYVEGECLAAQVLAIRMDGRVPQVRDVSRYSLRSSRCLSTVAAQVRRRPTYKAHRFLHQSSGS